MKNRLLAPLTALILPAVQAAEEPAERDFVRVTEADDATRLETAVCRYEKDGTTLELLGAIHIADVGYYDGLEKRFEEFDALLFEGIGDGKPVAVPKQAAAAAPKKAGSLDGLHRIYSTAADWLDLSYQMDQVDYTRPNFVHADLSVVEFRRLQASRDESILKFMLKLAYQPQVQVREPSAYGIIKALILRDPDGLKYEFVHSIAAADEQMAAIDGENVIVTDRNAKCLKVLDEQIAAGKTKLGIFYGAAHFPDMEKKLLESGWKRTGQEWLTAWAIER